MTTCIFSLHLALVLHLHENKLHWECMEFDIVLVHVTSSLWMHSFWFLWDSPWRLLKAIHTARLYGVCPSVCLSLSFLETHTAVNCLFLLVTGTSTVATICKYFLTEVQQSLVESYDGISCCMYPCKNTSFCKRIWLELYCICYKGNFHYDVLTCSNTKSFHSFNLPVTKKNTVMWVVEK